MNRQRPPIWRPRVHVHLPAKARQLARLAAAIGWTRPMLPGFRFSLTNTRPANLTGPTRPSDWSPSLVRRLLRPEATS